MSQSHVWYSEYIPTTYHPTSLILYPVQEFGDLAYMVDTGEWALLVGDFDAAARWAERNGWTVPDICMPGVYVAPDGDRYYVDAGGEQVGSALEVLESFGLDEVLAELGWKYPQDPEVLPGA